MRIIHLVPLLAYSLAVDEQYDSPEEISPNLPAVIPKSLKARPMGRSGFDDVFAPLLPPIEFPFHHVTDEFSPFQRGLMAERQNELKQMTLDGSNVTSNNFTIPWFDLSAAVARSIVDPVRVPELRYTMPPPTKEKGPPGNAYFLQGSFFLKEDLPGNSINWTTCEEFGKNAYFHPQEITNLNWVPFYVWSSEQMPASLHRFMVPTKKTVESYRTKQERFFNFTVDWKQPKLLLRREGTEVLLIALDRRGKFRALPWIAGLDESSVMLIRPMTVHLKIEAPYLVYMHCDMHHTTIMAVMGTEPKSKQQKIEEAESIGFVGVGYPVRQFAGQLRLRGDLEYRGPPPQRRPTQRAGYNRRGPRRRRPRKRQPK